MTREELKAHCERQIQQFERVKKIMPVTLNDWKRYEEHKLILELLEQEPKTGHWIETDEWRENVDGFEQWGYFHKCDKCGYVFKFLEIDNYCPNCGCRMEEVSNEQTNI